MGVHWDHRGHGYGKAITVAAARSSAPQASMRCQLAPACAAMVSTDVGQ
jgi:hypothetical protein